MKKLSKAAIRLFLAAAALASVPAAYANTIFVNDNWAAAAPTRSALSTPYENRTEDRIWLQVKTVGAATAGTFSLTQGPDDGNHVNGPDSVKTGLKNINYYANDSDLFRGPGSTNYDPSGSYNTAPPATIDDPTTPLVESIALTLGTNAFGTIKEAFSFIGQPGASGVTKIVILTGTYFEPIIVPNNTLNNATAQAYYTPLTNAGFFGEFATGFSIVGDPTNRPVVTRGFIEDNANTSGFTLANVYFSGVPGTNGNGVALASTNRIASFNGGATVFPYSSVTATTAAVRHNTTIENCTFDGLGILIPFGAKSPNGTGANFPDVNNVLNTSVGGRGGLQTDGEYGTFSLLRNTFRGIRNFTNYDSNGAGNSNSTWTTFIVDGNTLDDCWGNFSVRGEQIGTPGPMVGRADNAYIRNNTVRDMGVDCLIGYEEDATGALVPSTNPNSATGAVAGAFDFIYNHNPSSGAAFKMFNHRNGVFENNSIFRVNIMQDWFTKPVKVDPGHPDFIPMGAGVLVRDFRNSTALPAGPWPAKSVYTIRGNLFDSCQQGIGLDPVNSGANTARFIPDGVVTGNTFRRNRSAFYFFDGLISSESFQISDNIITEATDDPLNIGIGSGTNVDQDLVGGIVFGVNAGVSSEATTPTLDATDNYFGDPSGPGSTGILIATASPSTITTSTNTATSTITTGAPHGLQVGVSIVISGSDVAALNGTRTVNTVPSATTFTVALGATPGGVATTGTITRATVVTSTVVEGEEPGNFETVFPNLDLDGDGVSNDAEIALGTNPNLADTDGDGITDGVELRLGYSPTSNLSPSNTTDTDKDRIPDAVEVALGLDPADADTDNDGIRDDYELLVGSNPDDVASFPAFGDANENGVTNNSDAIRILEAFLNLATLNDTNKSNVDINRDGVVDNVDAIILYQKTLSRIDYIPFP